MKLLITGSTGFIGSALVKTLQQAGHELFLLIRKSQKVNSAAPKSTLILWNGRELPVHESLSQVEGVINLMGENIASQRWTAAQKERLLKSRVEGTRALVNYFSQRAKPLKLFISASAIGLYESSASDQFLDEDSPKGQGFLSSLCQQWEEAARWPSNTSITQGVTRCVTIRIGIVLGKEGGMLKKLIPLFKWGMGGRLGSGNQWMSWIHLEDLVRLIEEVVREKKYQGVYNAVAPLPIQQVDFSRALATALHRPLLLDLPAIFLKLTLGERASIMLDSHRVFPKNALKEEFIFHYTEIKRALNQIVGHP